MPLQQEEAQRLRKRKKAESQRLLEMQRRQKERLEEVRETQKKVGILLLYASFPSCIAMIISLLNQ